MQEQYSFNDGVDRHAARWTGSYHILKRRWEVSIVSTSNRLSVGLTGDSPGRSGTPNSFQALSMDINAVSGPSVTSASLYDLIESRALISRKFKGVRPMTARCSASLNAMAA